MDGEHDRDEERLVVVGDGGEGISDAAGAVNCRVEGGRNLGELGGVLGRDQTADADGVRDDQQREDDLDNRPDGHEWDAEEDLGHLTHDRNAADDRVAREDEEDDV